MHISIADDQSEAYSLIWGSAIIFLLERQVILIESEIV